MGGRRRFECREKVQRSLEDQCDEAGQIIARKDFDPALLPEPKIWPRSQLRRKTEDLNSTHNTTHVHNLPISSKTQRTPSIFEDDSGRAIIRRQRKQRSIRPDERTMFLSGGDDSKALTSLVAPSCREDGEAL